MRRTIPIRKLLLIAALVFTIAIFLVGCSSLTLSKVEDKWGPPSKIERQKDQIIYYFYFYKGKAKGTVVGSSVVASGSAEWSEGWIVVKFIADLNGNVLKERKYWKQPKMEPQVGPKDEPKMEPKKEY